MSFGKLAVDWEERINFERMRKERLEKAQRAMKAYGLEAMLVLTGPNMRYVAQNVGNVRNMPATGNRYVFLTRKGNPVLFEHGMWYPYIKENVPWLNVKPAIALGVAGIGQAATMMGNIYDLQLKKFADQIKNELIEHKLEGETIGIDAPFLPFIRALEGAGIKISLEGSKALTQARVTKTRDEIECLRMAASIDEAGFYAIKKSVRPGVTEMELRGIYANECLRRGADFIPPGDIISGPRTWNNNIITTDRSVRPGDLIVINACQLSYMGYRTCYYRTFVCGRPTQAQNDAYQKCLDYLYDAIKIIKPGVTTKDLAEKWPKAEEFGYPSEDAAFWVQWGHGIGLTVSEPPTITRIWSLQAPERLEPNMTIALETWWPTEEKSGTYPHGQAVRIEEMIVVTETGYDLLSLWPVDELTVCEY